ncbi:hypothetical protein O9993_13630 [Vibrio lentus]|nr:hypothetical protein [Vibrio lentus]
MFAEWLLTWSYFSFIWLHVKKTALKVWQVKLRIEESLEDARSELTPADHYDPLMTFRLSCKTKRNFSRFSIIRLP